MKSVSISVHAGSMLSVSGNRNMNQITRVILLACFTPALISTGPIAAALLLAVIAAPAAAQDEFHLWAAQTGPDQVSVAWDSVPGTAEYRLYLGDPTAPGTFKRRPASVLSASGRSGILTGVQRVVSGITLVAVDADRRVLRQAPFNPVVPATSFPPATPPSALNAEPTGTTEVTLSWDPVPGATAYLIGRAAHRSGFSTLCALCPTEPRYVDRTVLPGLAYTYTIAAIFPSGVSTRITSNSVTPGATSGTTASYTPPGQPASTTSSTTTSTTGTGSTTSTTGTASTATASGTGSTTSTSGTASTTTTTPSAGGLLGGLAGRLTSSGAPPLAVLATVTGPGAVHLSWQAPPISGIIGYSVQRRVNTQSSESINQLPASALSYDDGFFPNTFFASGPVRVVYTVVAQSSSGMAGKASNEVVVQAPPHAATSPSTGTVTTFRLEYQRADTMWAAFGHPDGALGVETLSLAPGTEKAFLTDWKYEKQRNDGTTYYGSHLRIATNPTSRTFRLHLRSLTLTGLAIFARTGSDTFWIRLDPNTTKQFQADLMEVFCEP
jgi:hypothetical protein